MNDYGFQNEEEKIHRVNGILVKTIIFVSVLIVLIIIGGVTYFALAKNSGNSISASATDKGVVVDVPTVKNFQEFEDNFRDCIPSSTSRDLNDKVSYYYEIIGPSNELCKVKTKAVNYPLEEFVGKSMICEHDSEVLFDFSISAGINCKGELYDLKNHFSG